MIKKIIIIDKGKNKIKTRNLKQKQRIRTYVQEAIKKNKQNDLQNKSLIIQDNKQTIKNLVKIFKRNGKVRGIPVKITNIINKKAQFLKWKRPIVINKNEKGINATENLKKIKDKIINLVAFKTRAQAIHYKLKFKLTNLYKNKRILIVDNITSKKIVNKSNNKLLKIKQEIKATQIQSISNLYKKTAKALLIAKKEVVTKFNSPKDKKKQRIFKKLLLLKKRINRFINYNTILLKKKNTYKNEKIIYIQTRNVAKKIKNKLLKFKWKTSQQFLKRRKKGLLIKYKQKRKEQEKKRLIHEFQSNKGLVNKNKRMTIKTASLHETLNQRFDDRSSSSLKILQKRYLDLYKFLILYKPRHKNNTKPRLSKRVKSDKIRRIQKKGGIKRIKAKVKQNSLKKKVEKKQSIRVRGQVRKKVITLVINEIDKRNEKSKENVVKVLLNIIRGISVGQEYINSNFGKNLIMYKYKYFSGIQNVANKAHTTLNIVDEDLQERLIKEFINKKDFSKALETETQLLRKFYEFVKIAKEFPKIWVPRAVFQPFIEKFIAKKKEYKYTKKLLNQMTGFQKKYNIINNIIAVSDENKVYSFKLPKKRLKVPTIRTIYKGLKLIGIPKYKTKKKYQNKKRLRLLRKRRKLKRKLKKLRKLGKKLPVRKIKKKKKKKEKTRIKVGVLKIKIKRKNMFLVFRDRKTNKVEAVTSARREYYRIFNTNDIDPMNKKKKNTKETTVKTKGPIGRYISTDHFRIRVLTQAFLDLRHKLRYKMLDIEIEKKYKKRFVRTIYKKYWYVFKPQGLFRICKFVKNKAHGQMRKKKARRI
jgi:hypothetical protein